MIWRWWSMAAAARRAKLQWNRHRHSTNKPSPTWLFTGRMPFLSPNQQCQSTEGNPDEMLCLVWFDLCKYAAAQRICPGFPKSKLIWTVVSGWRIFTGASTGVGGVRYWPQPSDWLRKLFQETSGESEIIAKIISGVDPEGMGGWVLAPDNM